MPKFKVGDEVVINEQEQKEGYYDCSKVGSKGKVTATKCEIKGIEVKFYKFTGILPRRTPDSKFVIEERFLDHLITKEEIFYE